jgi:hypothetical protein
MEGTITLQNGGQLNFTNKWNTIYDSNGNMTLVGDDTTDTPIPSYGIKRVGIADYRKVEQEVCCYDMGDVSHIENIMAREYKERSTRRLRRSEDTTTSEKTSETENLTDSTSTERFDMQKQTAQAMSESTSMGINASVGYNKAGFSSSLSGAFASNTSQQQSNNQAVQYSKDITQRASEKIVQKVREERVTKMIDEFEEQNKHGFDNRLGDKHVSGVYRWIDKIFKNQIFNYGKRLMYEFMIPQPAVFHNEAMKNVVANAPTTINLQKPIDPRVGDGVLRIKDHTAVNEFNYQYWAAIYNAEVEPKPLDTITVGKAFDHYSKDANEGAAKTGTITIPDGYITKTANVYYTGGAAGGSWGNFMFASVGNKAQYAYRPYLENNLDYYFILKPFKKEIPVAALVSNYHMANVTISVVCNLSVEAYAQWQLKTFNAIINAYETKLEAYNKSLPVAVAETVRGTNPGFYRTIENTVLRKCCISYLVSHTQMGANKHYTAGNMMDIKPNNDAAMESYAALVKFIEQAFEWEILSYTFYPFYWAFKADWQSMYQQDNDDHIFRAFLQSGMARTMLSVRPGFEEAVMYYMATGKVWNGGKVPVIGDDLYLSIVEELKNPAYYIEDTWETRIPTTLTLIQEGGIAAEANGLPCNCGDANGIKQSNEVLQALPAITR